MKILSGDLGGTKTVLAIVYVTDASYNIVRKQTYSSRGHDFFEEIISEFLRNSAGECDYACFGVCGPIEGGAVYYHEFAVARRYGNINFEIRIDPRLVAQRFGSPCLGHRMFRGR